MKKLLVTIVLFWFSSLIFGQEASNSSMSVQIGSGFSFANFSDNNDGSLCLSGSLNYKINNNNFSIGVFNVIEFILFTRPSEYITSYDIKYGRSINFKMRGLVLPIPLLLIVNRDFKYSLVGKVGLSYIRSLSRTNLLENNSFDSVYASEILTGFGIPIELELREEITSFFGMGLSVYTNINSVKNFTGFNLNVYLGSF